MKKQLLFNFKTDISSFDIPSELNNPFGVNVPEIAKIAAEEFQDFIAIESDKWNYNFHTQKGKMFGVLVVQNQDKTYSYLGTVSGKLPGRLYCERFIPSVFDDSIDDFFINRGMTELTRIGDQIKKTENPSEIYKLKEKSRLKSIALQKQLFENYNFVNLSGKEENLIHIFKNSSHGNPPVAAGDCTAPKLLQYAIEHELKPIAIAEFWWGSPIKKNGKKHKAYYPACKDRCRPILEYMLEDTTLFDSCQ
ncbi:pseudouridylate synthase [Urechidicola vernalis]|uniref:Pseudouridylate synthase n=1 Tax=Urechidicola vernalis TaxID=3075600 RepID=A0ABU2Y8R6_9FLAO|nr:pseudouridylate synthase [Urechidicola sp. P050]MDT0554220.1 pseudouridylate synthase [Urechidicola sp. P050]